MENYGNIMETRGPILCKVNFKETATLGLTLETVLIKYTNYYSAHIEFWHFLTNLPYKVDYLTDKFTYCDRACGRQTRRRIRYSYESLLYFADQSRRCEYSSDGERLRGKVQSLQKMMQERKTRRQEKRGLRAPYQWPHRSSNFQHSMRAAKRVNYESPLAREREINGKAEPHPATEATFTPTSALEHESVLVWGLPTALWSVHNFGV